PRTGNAAVDNVNYKDEYELLDSATLAKRLYVDKRVQQSNESSLTKDLIENDEGLVWPVNMEKEEDEKAFPFIGDNQYVGVIHADGNGLGEILLALKEEIKKADRADYQNQFLMFSNKLNEATKLAARCATKEVLVSRADKVVPARPLVLGGDDLSFIVRADLAIPFAAKFIQYFEEVTEAKLGDMEILKNLKIENLTACAGIAFIKAKQPFYLAYELAESLCKYAKTISKSTRKKNNLALTPSSIAFHRITTSMIDDYPSIMQNELIVGERLLTLQPYVVGGLHANMPALSSLVKLKSILRNDAFSAGPLRELASLIYTDKQSADNRFDRWLTVMRSKHASLLSDFEEALNNLCTECGMKRSPNGLFFENSASDFVKLTQFTPLPDVIDWIAVEGNQYAEFENLY
ncbi:MAG: hypothetical protein OEZ58_20645, partial [Gammaproteobacteria bacterium]|nr:hypothetical protein [Gammaproteobacteria bacterium]